ETLREEALHHVAEAATQGEEWRLCAVPWDEAVCFVRGGEIAHDVDAGGAGESGRADVDGDENGAALGVGHGAAVVEAGIFVALARLDDLEAVLFESDFYLSGEVEIEVALADAGGAARAQVGAAVSCIEDDDAGALTLRLGCGLCGLRGCS